MKDYREELYGTDEREDRRNMVRTSDQQKFMEPRTKTGTIHCVNLVAVRAEANSSSTAVAYLNNGEKVSIFGSEEDYLKIESKDRTAGYISSKFCKED